HSANIFGAIKNSLPGAFESQIGEAVIPSDSMIHGKIYLGLFHSEPPADLFSIKRFSFPGVNLEIAKLQRRY
ncbi:MAG: hypothetical protein RMM53_03520, partial [Bacteroidia bacterium]|nr:hypothetical protein [Bacteroidia bacterium]